MVVLTWGPDRIDVVVHPQSVVHSLIELRDGSVIAQLGVDRHAAADSVRAVVSRAMADRTARLSILRRCGRLDFAQPDTGQFPCLGLAYRALQGGSALPVILNAANEIAV